MVLLSCYLTQYWLSYKENKYGVNSWWGHSLVSSPCPAGLLSSKSSKWRSTTKVLPDRGCWLSHVTCHVTYNVTWLCEWDMSCDWQSHKIRVSYDCLCHMTHIRGISATTITWPKACDMVTMWPKSIYTSLERAFQRLSNGVSLTSIGSILTEI